MSDTTPATLSPEELPTPLQCLRNLSSLILPNLTIFHDERAEKILDETVEVLRYGDAHAAALTRELEAARAFKAYVHKRLDDAGIPVDPESPHKAEGCRIGGRLDVVLGELEAARAGLAELWERMSEVVGPVLEDGCWWGETLPDGSEIPVMRGSPKLAAFIAKLHHAAATAQQERDALAARVAELERAALSP